MLSPKEMASVKVPPRWDPVKARDRLIFGELLAVLQTILWSENQSVDSQAVPKTRILGLNLVAVMK